MIRSEVEIRDCLEMLREQYEESNKNPFKGDPTDTLTNVYTRKEQIDREITWMDEIAILEWVLGEKQILRTSWMR